MIRCCEFITRNSSSVFNDTMANILMRPRWFSTLLTIFRLLQSNVRTNFAMEVVTYIGSGPRTPDQWRRLPPYKAGSFGKQSSMPGRLLGDFLIQHTTLHHESDLFTESQPSHYLSIPSHHKMIKITKLMQAHLFILSESNMTLICIHWYGYSKIV